MKQILLYGYGSENLNNYLITILNKFPKNKLIIINNYNNSKVSIKNKKFDMVIFSAHLHVDKKIHSKLYFHCKNFMDPIKILKNLKIKKKYYLVHDLTEFYHNNEISKLIHIDKILSPIKYCDPLFNNKIIDIGWAKAIDNSNYNLKNKKIFFVSDAGYYNKHIDHFKSDFQKFFHYFDYFKMPIYKKNKICTFLKSIGKIEINQNYNSYHLIKGNEIYTNGVSSLIFETLCWKKKIKIFITRTNANYNFKNLEFTPFTSKKLIKKITIKRNIVEIHPNKFINLKFKKKKFLNLINN